MEGFIWVFVVILAIAAIGFGIWGIVRWRYVEALRAKGWTFVSSPDISIVHGLNVPPFGVGFSRRVDDQVVGKAPDGTPFSAFEYQSSNWRSNGYVVAMPLTHSMPPAQIAHESAPDLGLPGSTVALGQVRATAEDRAYAEQLASAAAPEVQGPWRISVDHNTLVLVDAPKQPDELDRAVANLAAVRRALLNSPAAAQQGPRPPGGLSFFERPWWTYVPRDDSFLGYIGHTRGGSNHEAHDIIYSDNAGLPFMRLTHRWTTTRTVTDSEGRTRTETDHHKEVLCQFRTAFPFRPISVNWGLFGRGQRFELEGFNERFKVKSPDPRFASAVIHQRQMEYLMGWGAPSFSIEADGLILMDGRDWLPEDIDRADSLLRGFFARVPDFVWDDLGTRRPIPEITAG